MRALSLAWRGLWWRRGASLTIFLLAVTCVAVAAAGPAYLAGTRDAVTQTTLREADVDAEGTGVSVGRQVRTGPVRLDTLLDDVSYGFADLERSGTYVPPVGSVDGIVHVAPFGATGTGISSSLTSRTDVCAHVVVEAGSCVADSDPAGVMVTATAAATLGVALGDVTPYTDFAFRDTRLGPLRVRGIYEPLDPDGPYWFAATRDYFDATASTDAVLAPSTTWPAANLSTGLVVTTHADLALDPGAVRAAGLPTLTEDVRRAVARLHTRAPDASAGTDIVTTDLPAVVFTARQAVRSLAVPVASVAGQLVVLTIAVLFLVMVSSSESRASELTLGKLHGLRTRAAVLHAVLEPALLLATAVPVGVGACALVLHLVSDSAFGSTAHAGFGPATWTAAVAAGVGGLVATLLAAVSALRRPVLEQWRRTERRPGRRAWIVDAIVVTAAVGGAVQLTSRPPDTAGADVLPIVAPALLAVAFALVGARTIPLLARAGAALTRGRRGIVAFVALRQLARRRDDVRVFGLLCVTVGLLVFGLSSQSVFTRNRLERARVEVGADRVVVLADTGGEGPDVRAVVARLDPGGTSAAAVFQGLTTVQSGDGIFTDDGSFTSGTVTSAGLLVVDPSRFAAVATWRPDYGPEPELARQLAPADRGAPTPPSFAGTSLQVAGTVTTNREVDLRVGVTDTTGHQFDVDLGTLTPAGTAASVDVAASAPRCRDGCTVRRFSLIGPATAAAPLIATVELTTVTALGADGTATPLLPGLRAASWTALNPPLEPSQPVVDSVRAVGTALEVAVTAVEPPFLDRLGYGAQADVAPVIPGLVTGSLTSTLAGQAVTVEPTSGDPVAVQPTSVAVLPRVGDVGVVVSWDWVVASHPEGFTGFTPNQVWLSSSAPSDFPARLQAAGVRVGRVESVAERAQTLSRQGPSFAVAMLTFGGVAAAVLAVGGASATLFVASRRRLFELAALRALGMRPARMLASVVLEHVLVAVAAAGVGLGAGLLGARLALATLPEFADDPSFPPLLTDLPVGLTTLAAAGVAVAVGSVAAVGDAVLVRRADAARLREAQV